MHIVHDATPAARVQSSRRCIACSKAHLARSHTGLVDHPTKPGGSQWWGAEVGGGLGLHHGAPQETTPYLCASTVLNDWLVACQSDQPMVIFWRRGFPCGAEAAQLVPPQPLQAAAKTHHCLHGLCIDCDTVLLRPSLFGWIVTLSYCSHKRLFCARVHYTCGTAW